MRGRLGQVLYAKSHQNRIEIAWKIACVNGPLEPVGFENSWNDARFNTSWGVRTKNPDETRTFPCGTYGSVVSYTPAYWWVETHRNSLVRFATSVKSVFREVVVHASHKAHEALNLKFLQHLQDLQEGRTDGRESILPVLSAFWSLAEKWTQFMRLSCNGLSARPTPLATTLHEPPTRPPLGHFGDFNMAAWSWSSSPEPTDPPARLIPPHNRCLLGMWIPLVGLPVFRSSLGRLVWGRRCSAAANGGRKYKQLLSTNSTMESVWCEDCVNCKRWGHR